MHIQQKNRLAPLTDADFSPDALDFSSDIQPLIQKATSREAFVDSLIGNNKSKLLLEQFVPMHTSQSNQAENTSPDFPRMISYAGRTLMALTDNPHGKNTSKNNQVEFIEFNVKENKYDFYLASFNNIPPTVSKNPKSCNTCHNGLPIWESYPVWPGAYEIAQAYPQRVIKSKDGNIVGHKEKLTGLYRKYSFEKTGSKGQLFEDATNLGAFIADTLYSQLATQIKSLPDFEKLQYAIMGSLMSCSNLDKLLPEKIDFKELQQRMLKQEGVAVSNNQVLNKKFNENRLSGTEASDGSVPPSDYLDAAQWIMLDSFLTRRGVKVTEFTISEFLINNVGYSFFLGVGAGGFNSLMCHLFEDKLAQPDFKFLVNYTPAAYLAPLKFYDFLKRDSSRDPKSMYGVDINAADYLSDPQNKKQSDQRDQDCLELEKLYKERMKPDASSSSEKSPKVSH